GIKERRVLSEQNLNELAFKAAREALEDAGVDGKDIDLVLVATTMADYLFPSLACLLTGEIGTNCPAMDIHAACAGFIYCLRTAEAYLKTGMANKVLVVGAEAISRLADWNDRSTCVLFGDGAGAVVLENGDDLLSIRLSTQSNDRVLFYHAAPGNCPYTKGQAYQKDGLTMEGQDVFRYAVSQSEKDLSTVLNEAGLGAEEVDWVFFHQANRRIIDTVRRRLNLDPKKLPMNIHRTGNTSAASIPLLMWELYHAGKLLPGQTLAMSAFGAGLTSGACVIRWSKEKPEVTVDGQDLFPA
ncbi:MAG: beta-ketoacyl-ACP synthase III, partial [Bacillota bacterium]|nr:beta-ketoacyl-ACP synthase III [Bacillota bacterium]